MSNPVFSLKFVHNAISAELAAFQSAARSNTDVAAMLDGFDFFMELMHFHHQGEESAVFPLLDESAPGYAATYLFDHKEETAHLASLREQICAARDGGDFDLRAFQDELTAVVSAGLTHIEKENTLVLPELAARFSPPEQGAIVGKVLAVIPKEKMPALVPWIIARQNDDDAEAYVRGLMAGMPAPVFAAAKGWIHGGVDQARWNELRSRVPELAS